VSADARKFDVAIVGGGPAGTSAAIALAIAGARVLVLERSGYEDPRIGEMLPPVAKSVLARLGVWEMFVAAGHRPTPAVLSAWGAPHPISREAIFDPNGSGWHLDRRAFDAMLAGAAETAGASVWRHARLVGLSGQSGAWRLDVIDDGRAVELSAAVIVDATGRAATWARRLGGAAQTYDALVGVVGTVEAASWTARQSDADANGESRVPTDVTAIEAIADGWWYSAPLPDGSLVVTFMTDADLLPRDDRRGDSAWRAALALSDLTRRRCGPMPRFVRDVRVVSARSQSLCPAAGDGWFAVGDAALAMDPLSSGGVVEALLSGLGAAAAIVSGQSSASIDYETALRQRVVRYLKSRQSHYARETRWQRSAFWSRRQSDARGFGVTERDQPRAP